MNRDRIIETFNTHRMTETVVRSVATSRREEMYEVMAAIEKAASSPELTPQHIVIYGERGAGKSFLMRLIEIEVARLARDKSLPVIAALLPEEQYNIRNISQLLQSVINQIKGLDWSANSFKFEQRSQVEVWNEALVLLKQGLDERFGKGKGLVIAMVENFDALVKDLFGSEPVDDRKPAGPRALEQGIAEQLLRKLLSTPGSRFMLIASATGTVDQNYDRPLFQAFKGIDLVPWSEEDCVEYFNRRRALAGQPELLATEQARVKAIGRFIGGNPRLAQLLGDVLNSQDAYSIAEVLNGLSDHLADYYRHRLEDLSPQSASLLDALIRGGEPTTQKMIAERVGATSQSQIADAFGNLINGRLLAAESERGGSSNLYRVKDRLFVHFYRRRYGDANRSTGLAPIAELLESFYTTAERELIARRYLEAGQLADADIVAPRTSMTGSNAYTARAADGGSLKPLFASAGTSPSNWDALSIELNDWPERALKRWSESARLNESSVIQVSSLALGAIALELRQLHHQADEQISNLIETAKKNPDAKVIAIVETAFFRYAAGHRREGIAILRRLNEVNELLSVPTAKYLKAYAFAYIQYSDNQYENAVIGFAEAQRFAIDAGFLVSAARCECWRARALLQLNKLDEALEAAEAAKALSSSSTHDSISLECIVTIAQIKNSKSEPREALALIQKGLSAESENRVADEESRRFAELQQAEISSTLGEFEQANKLLRKLILEVVRIDLQWIKLNAQQTLAENLIREGRFVEAATIVREGLKNFDATERNDDFIALRLTLIEVSRWIGIDDLPNQVEHLLIESPVEKAKNLVSAWAGNIFAGATRSESLSKLVSIPGFLSALISDPPLSPFKKVGVVWGEIAKTEGRAIAYANAVKALPGLKVAMESIPNYFAYRKNSDAIISHLAGLTSGLISVVEDSNLLLDLAGLLKLTFGEKSHIAENTLLAFSAVRAAKDPIRALQKVDPDIAVLIRSVLSLPEPKDTLSRKGRRKAR